MARTDPTFVDRRDYLRLAGALAAGATAGLAGCAENVPGGTGSTGGSTDGGGDGATATGLLSTAVSDQPGDIGDFESCIVTLDGIWVGPEVGSEEDDGDDDGGNETDADAEAAEEEDETDGETEQNDGDAGGPPADAPPGGNSSSEDTASGSQDGNETEDGGNATDPEDSGESDDDSESEEDDESDGDDGSGENDGNGRTYYEFEEAQEADLTELQGEAQQLVGEHELAVGTYRFLQLDVAGVRGTLTDGSEAEVTTPGNAPLRFDQSFDVREGYRTTFLADFTPVRRGNGSYLFQPVASETEVSYQEIESGSGDSGGSDGDSATDSGDDATDEDSGTDSDGAGGNATAPDGGNTSNADGGNRTA